ncbi:MAG: peptidoglycan DD-metalloendopeptidase family protein [Actinomycetota bacterium]|nr:peptidoglycan DD-metalloendopeptidase family protein [Actinomycetota bacterium]
MSNVASPSLVGGLALVVAAIGAAAAGQAISAGHDVTPASAQRSGTYVATLSGASLEGRDATRVSRSGIRPPLTSSTAATKAAQRRTSKLSDAAGVADDYAQELADERRKKLRIAARAAKVYAQELADERRKKLRIAAREARVYAQELADERRDKLREAAMAAKVYAQELADDEWVMPISGSGVSTWFGESGPYWSSGYHTGIDFSAAYGTPGVAVANATVVQTGWDGAYGNQVRLQLENGDEVWYNHLSSIDVVSGQSVVKGQQVGRIGDTGNSYGAHLHLEYRLVSNLGDGVDPRLYFLEHGISL